MTGRDIIASEADKEIADRIFAAFGRTRKTPPTGLLKVEHKEAILFTVAYIADELRKANEPSSFTDTTKQSERSKNSQT